MPKLNFVTGSEVPAAWFNAMQDIKFDGNTGVDGSYQKIPDSWLSTAPGNLLANFTDLRDSLAVTNAGGLVAGITAGRFTNDAGLAVTVGATTTTVPANASTYIWLSNTGAIQSGTNYPVRSLLLALVTTNASSIVSIVDLRPRYTFLPQSRAISTFGGGSQQDITYSSNTTLNGKVSCRNLTVAAGVTISVPGGYLEIEASGNVSIQGSIDVTPIARGGQGFSGTPFPGLLYFAESGNGLGGAGGHAGVASPPYHYSISPLGSGGASGLGYIPAGSSATSLTQSKGGNGGGAVLIKAAGTITVSGSINCPGGNGTIGTFTGGSGTIQLTGGGGGSGGSIQLYSLTSVTITGQLLIVGGTGAAATGLNPGNTLAGGFGGSGGWIAIQSPLISTGGSTLNNSAGGPGASFGSGGVGIAGSIGGSFASQGQANGLISLVTSLPN